MKVSPKLLYTPQATLSILTATALAHKPNALAIAGTVNAATWIAQFVGHGVFEKRAPALLDNLLGGASDPIT